MDEEGYPDRIISNNEREKLELLLRSQDLEYPNYEEWVSNTIKQVESGEKIAFGFFTSANDIVGDGIIRITASNTVELKNFFLQEDFRSRGIGSILLEYIENYCIERGCTQIHVDMSIDDRDIIRFFIKNDYEFQARGDFYGQGKESYLLVKKLPIKYIGDYDWIAISRWVMNRIFEYTLVKRIDTNSFIYSKKISGVNLTATISANEDIDREQNDAALKNLLKSVLIKGNLIYFAPYFSSSAIDYANEKGITLIDRNKLEQLSGFTLPTSSKDTAGIIVVIKPEYYKQLVKNKDRVFIKGGGAPTGVENNQVLLFYITSPIQAIGGYTQIKKITGGHPSDIWKKYSRQSAFPDLDYKTYTEGKSIVTAYSFENIKKLKKNISLESIRKTLGSFNHQAGQRISAKEWANIKRLF